MGDIPARSDGSGPSIRPIMFHTTHSPNIYLDHGRTVARQTDHHHRLVFSHRPIEVNERVHVQLWRSNHHWDRCILAGFTAHDPADSQAPNILRQNSFADIINKLDLYIGAGFIPWSQPDRSVFTFHVNESGDVHYEINGEEKGLLTKGVYTGGPLWATIDLSNHLMEIKLVPKST